MALRTAIPNPRWSDSKIGVFHLQIPKERSRKMHRQYTIELFDSGAAEACLINTRDFCDIEMQIFRGKNPLEDAKSWLEGLARKNNDFSAS